jgi:hypothetical protein
MHVLKLSTMRMMLWPEMVVRLQRFADTKDTQYVCHICTAPFVIHFFVRGRRRNVTLMYLFFRRERFFWTRAYRIFRLEHRALQIPPLFVYPVCVVVMLVSNVFAFRYERSLLLNVIRLMLDALDCCYSKTRRCDSKARCGSSIWRNARSTSIQCFEFR